MPQNPLSDTWDFLLANTGDYNNVGMAKYLLAALFLCCWSAASRSPA